VNVFAAQCACLHRTLYSLLSCTHRRELLRHELHSYGALQLEPDMTTSCGTIATALESSPLESLFSNAGSLKHSLKVLIAAAQDPERIYNRLVHTLAI
jgi:hypothetical protein